MFTNLVAYNALTTPDPPPLTAQAYEYLLASNGLWLHAENRFLRALLPVVRFPTDTVRGLHPLHVPQLWLKVPPLPYATLQAVVQDARTRRDARGALCEALYRFHHDGQRVRAERPAQAASPMSVQSAGDGGAAVILELHSHGALRAFWSETDDHDEKGFRVYGVLGRVDRDPPELRLRLGVYGQHLDLLLGALFHLPPADEPLLVRDLNVEQGVTVHDAPAARIP